MRMGCVPLQSEEAAVDLVLGGAGRVSPAAEMNGNGLVEL